MVGLVREVGVVLVEVVVEGEVWGWEGVDWEA